MSHKHEMASGKHDGPQHHKLEEARTKLQEAKESAFEAASAASEGIKEKIKEGSAEAKIKMEETAKEMKKKLNNVEEEVTTYVKEHPWKSIGICVLAGAVFAKLFGHRK